MGGKPISTSQEERMYVSKIRSSTEVQSDVEATQKSIATCCDRLSCLDSDEAAANNRPVPKTVNMQQLTTAVNEHQTQIANIAAERSGVAITLSQAEEKLKILQAELVKSQAEEARVAALESAWQAYDASIRGSAKLALQIWELSNGRDLAMSQIHFLRPGQSLGSTSISELAQNKTFAADFFQGVE